MGEFLKYRRGVSGFKKIVFLTLVSSALIFISVLFGANALYLISFVPFMFLPLYITFYRGLILAFLIGYLLESLAPYPAGVLIISYTLCFTFSDILREYINIKNIKAWIYSFSFIYLILSLLLLFLDIIVAVKLLGRSLYFIKEFTLGLFLLIILFYTLGIKDEGYSSIRS